MMCTIQSRHTRKKAQQGSWLILWTKERSGRNVLLALTHKTHLATLQAVLWILLLEWSNREGWPQSFHKPLTKPIIMMSISHRNVRVGDVTVFDTALIFSRVLCLQNVKDVNIEEVIRHELAGVPTSIFEDTGEMRLTQSKLFEDKSSIWTCRS